MCESDVFLATPEGEQLLLADVASIVREQDGYRLVTLFGERAHVRGRLISIDLVNHRVLFESPPQ